MVKPFTFPGFVYARNQDSDTTTVVIGTIKEDGHSYVVHVHQLKERKDGPYKIAQISGKGSSWARRQENFPGSTRLAMADDRIVIAFVGYKSGQLERVTPLRDLFALKPVNLRERLLLKQAAAKFLGLRAALTDTEKVIDANERRLAPLRKAEADRAAAEDARKAREEEARAAEQARRDQREERVRAILIRPRRTVYGADGRPFTGIPATENEWQSLPANTHVVLVNAADEPQEAFTVIKRPGRNPIKSATITVTSEKQERTTVAITNTPPEPSGEVAVMIGDVPYAVALYPSMDDIRAARRAGLNGGSYVAVDPNNASAPLEVFQVFHDRVDTIGLRNRMR